MQVNRIVNRRFAAYRVALAQRRLAITRANIAAAAAASQAQAQAQAVSAPVYTPSAAPARARGHPPAARHHQDLVMQTHTFHAMGTTFELVVEADRRRPTRSPRPRRRSNGSSRSCRAFGPTRSCRSLNRDGAIDASHDLAEVVELALAARERTGGRFDPTIHDALVGAGYDRTFDDVPERQRCSRDAVAPAAAA